jgi:hypothetical protein
MEFTDGQPPAAPESLAGSAGAAVEESNSDLKPSAEKTEFRPNVLVLGGCGYLGRNFVLHLIRNDLVSFVRVVDKIIPVMAYFHKDCDNAFLNPKVQFIQGDLTR